MTTRPTPASPKPAETTAASVAAEAVSQHIGYLLARSHQRFRQATVEALAGSGLNPGQLAVLGALSAVSGLSQTELTTVTGIEKSSMVLLVDSLESAGWVRRRPHATDRRAHALALTPRGAQRLRTIGPALQAAADGVLNTLTPAQRRSLLGLLQRLSRPGGVVD